MSRKGLASCSWIPQKVRGTPPSPRQGHAAAVIGEDVYVFGGSTATEDGSLVHFYNDLYRLHVDSKEKVTWERLKQQGAMPSPRDGHSLCAVDDKIYLYGGKDHLDATECLPGLYLLEPEKGLWREVMTTGTAPDTLGHTLCRVGPALYVIGGLKNGEASNGVCMLHLHLHTWVPLRVSGPCPEPRCDHAVAVAEEMIYIFGGCSSEDIFYNDLYVLDTVTLTWMQLKVKGVPPSPRACHTLTAHRTKDIYVFGGTNDSVKGNLSVSGDLCKLSLAKPRWKWPLFTGSGPEGRLGHAAFIVHSQLYVLGGMGFTHQFGDVHALRLINPSDRQPVIKPLFEGSAADHLLPTRTPNLRYSLNHPPFSTVHVPDVALEETLDPQCPLQSVKDLHNLKMKTAEAIDKAIDDLQLRTDAVAKREAEVEAAERKLQQERSQYETLYQTQQKELEEMICRHKMMTEEWLKSRRAENDRERQAISEEKGTLQKEHAQLEEGKVELARKAQLLRNIAKQFKHSYI